MKKLLCVILATIMIVCSVPFSAFAETIIQDNEDIISEEEYIYYSDLFYGYSHYLNNYTLSNHHFQTQMAMSNVFSEYVNTPAFGWAGFSETLNLFSSMSDLAKAYTDQFGLTDFQYQSDLNAANKKFISKVFDLKMNIGDGLTGIGKTSSQLDGVVSTIEKLYQAKESDTLVLSEALSLVIDDAKVFCDYTVSLIPSLNDYILEYLDSLSKPLSTASEIFEFSAALATAIAMEDVRMEIVSNILDTQDKDSILYEGMYKLKTQLEDGYIGYFVDTYLTNKIIDEIAKGITKQAQNIILGSVNSVCAAVTSSVGLINDIVFDWILGDTLSSLEDYRVTMILAQYSDLLYDSVLNKQTEFTKQFEVSQVKEYETLFNAYLSATEFALEQCSNLAYYNDAFTPEYIGDIVSQYCQTFSYGSHIDSVKSAIRSIPFDERKHTYFDNWNLTSDTYFAVGSDSIDSTHIYFTQSTFNGNLYVAPRYIAVNEISQPLIINGTVTLGRSSWGYYGKLYNYGDLSISGDIQGYEDAK